MYTIENKDFKDISTECEGIVILGAGGELKEWVDGISSTLLEKEITKTSNPEDLFSEFMELKTTGGRTDLVLVFRNFENFNMGKLAIWRLAFGNCSWISDYLVNYADQHGYSCEFDEDDEDDE